MPLLRALFSRPDVDGLFRVRNVSIEANILGEAIVAIENIANVSIVPHDPPKWFRVYSLSDDLNYTLIDIHIQQEHTRICPQQNVDYVLLPDDTIMAGVIVCWKFILSIETFNIDKTFDNLSRIMVIRQFGSIGIAIWVERWQNPTHSSPICW